MAIRRSVYLFSLAHPLAPYNGATGGYFSDYSDATITNDLKNLRAWEARKHHKFIASRKWPAVPDHDLDEPENPVVPRPVLRRRGNQAPARSRILPSKKAVLLLRAARNVERMKTQHDGNLWVKAVQKLDNIYACKEKLAKETTQRKAFVKPTVEMPAKAVRPMASVPARAAVPAWKRFIGFRKRG